MNKYKEKYFKKVYDEAPFIECGCGCGELIKSKDKYGRDKKFISGHNARKYEIGYDPREAYRLKPENKEKKRKHRKQKRRERNHNLKIELITLKGGKCVHCGVKHNGKNSVMFDMHHIKDKEFNLNAFNFEKYKKEEIFEEAKKCILLCANCHRLEHHKGW